MKNPSERQPLTGVGTVEGDMQIDAYHNGVVFAHFKFELPDVAGGTDMEETVLNPMYFSISEGEVSFGDIRTYIHPEMSGLPQSLRLKFDSIESDANAIYTITPYLGAMAMGELFKAYRQKKRPNERLVVTSSIIILDEESAAMEQRRSDYHDKIAASHLRKPRNNR